MKLILKKRLLQGPPSELCGHPAWRWRYALALFGAHVRAPQGADPLVREAVVYLQARATNGPRADRRFGPLVRAARIYAASGTERWMIEALLLGGATPRDVTRLWPITPTAVERYTALFFDVLGPRSQPLYILNAVFRAHQTGSLSQPEIWKWLSYARGYQCLVDFVQPGLRLTPEQRKQLLRLTVERALKKALAAALQLPAHPGVAVAAQRRVLAGPEPESESSDGPSRGRTDLAAHMKSVVDDQLSLLGDYFQQLQSGFVPWPEDETDSAILKSLMPAQEVPRDAAAG